MNLPKKINIIAKQKIRLLLSLKHRKKLIVFAFIIFIVLCTGVGLFFVTRSRDISNRALEKTSAPQNSISTETIQGSDAKESAPPVPTTIPSPVPVPVVPAKPSPPSPNSILNLLNWKLTLPTNSDNSRNPDEIKWPEIKTYSNQNYFYLNSDNSGVVFRAPTNGATTANSQFPRSELREMARNGSAQASWSSTNGSHRMLIREAITHLPTVKPEVVVGQIHDDSSDVIMIRLDDNNLFIQSNGKNISTLDSDYKLGTLFTVELMVSEGHIKIYYNSEQKLDYAKNGDGYYFKAGCYTQSNASKGENSDSYGEVIIYQLEVTHS